MTDPHVQGADRATSRQWQGYLRCAAERAALWWVAHVVEANPIGKLADGA
jgi:hypothetical protein